MTIHFPSTMRASILTSPGELEIVERPTPIPARDQVLVRVASVGVCGSDVHYYHEGRIGSFVVEEPLVLGHEASGVIVAVGDDVDPGRVGERVSIEPQRSCRTCSQCKAGRYNLCEYIEFYATPPIDGAFAEYVVIQSDFAHVIGDEISDDAAALIEPLSVAVWALQKARVQPGHRVLIAGAGPIGIVLAQVARVFGATEVVVSDPAEARRTSILRYGATTVIDPVAEPIPTGYFDSFIDASGSGVAVRQGIDAVRSAGTVVLVGMGQSQYELPVATIQNRELELTGVFRYANTWPTAIALVSTGMVELDSLVTGRFTLEDVQRALESTSLPSTLKSIVTPGAA